MKKTASYIIQYTICAVLALVTTPHQQAAERYQETTPEVQPKHARKPTITHRAAISPQHLTTEQLDSVKAGQLGGIQLPSDLRYQHNQTELDF